MGFLVKAFENTYRQEEWPTTELEHQDRYENFESHERYRRCRSFIEGDFNATLDDRGKKLLNHVTEFIKDTRASIEVFCKHFYDLSRLRHCILSALNFVKHLQKSYPLCEDRLVCPAIGLGNAKIDQFHVQILNFIVNFQHSDGIFTLHNETGELILQQCLP